MTLRHRLAAPLGRRNVDRFKYAAGRVLTRHLEVLARLFGGDKRGALHNYTAVYPIHLQDRRRSVRRVLEIGIGGGSDPALGGSSLRMWQAYFPDARIVGLDLFPKDVTGPRITTLVCDQSDPAALRAVWDAHGPFDVVIDDGSHEGPHVDITFRTLFPLLEDGALYVIEDTHTSYLEMYDGGPPGTAPTAASVTKELVDAIHLTDDVRRIDVHKAIVFIDKGPPVTRAQLD
jgi:hypothetical protein